MIVVFLAIPLVPLGVHSTGSAPQNLRAEAAPPAIESLVFPGPLNTSGSVPEYTMVSRALMLPGGSADAKLIDLNGDGLTDLMVAVYEEKKISIFYRQSDGTFLTYPSFNLTTMNNPFAIAPIDVFATGGHQIASLERNVLPSGTRLIIYNLTSETTYDTWPYTPTYSNAVGLVVGNFSSDNYPDIAVACAGPNPGSTPGRIDVFFGPDLASWGLSEVLLAGLGTDSIAEGDVDNDGVEELAVGNYYDSSVMVYHQPFDMAHYLPHQVVNVTGNVTGLATGKLHWFDLQDLAVVTENPSAVHLYFQDASPYLPPDEDLNLSLSAVPSCVDTGDMNGDGQDDLLILSARDNVTLGFYQRSTNPIWMDSPDFEFPTGAIPRSALIGDLNGDLQPDISVASARGDWSGGTIAVYPARAPRLSNANATAWTNRSTYASMVATGDLNGDDVIDLVSLNPANSSFDYLFSFMGTTGTVPLNYMPAEVIVADLNCDGFSDVLTSMSSGHNLTITFGALVFPGSTLQLTCGGNVVDVATGDFNGDGLIDILAATDDGKLDIFFNNGSSQPFVAPYEYVATPGSGIWSVAVGDFDSDGLDDIAFTRSIRKITILFQDPSIPFGAQSPRLNLSYSTGPDFAKIWSGDVTGDGKADIIAMRTSDPTLYIFNQTMFPRMTQYAKLILPEVPKFVSVLDATDRGRADVVAVFNSEDLLFLYRQDAGGLPSTPSMVFVTGAGPNYATIGDGTRDHRGDLLVNEVGSHTVSAWEMIDFPPVVNAGGPYEAREGDLLQLNATVVTGTSMLPYMNYTWDFGDSSPLLIGRHLRPTHNYTVNGTYTITVTVRDPANLTSTDQTWVNVYDAYPHVAFSWTPLSPREGQLVNFTDQTYSFDGFLSIVWKIDGVTVGTGHTLSVEPEDGNHTVTLEVTDLDGTVMNKSAVLEVRSMPPELRIVAPISADEGETVTFEVLVDEWHGGPVDPILSYEWDFSYLTGIFIPDPYVSNSSTATHVFSAQAYSEIYRVAVRVTDADSQVNISTWDIAIFNVGPTANFTQSTNDPQEGVPFSFVSSCTSFDGIVEWNWTLTYPDGHSESFFLDDVAMAGMKFANLQDGDYVMSLTIGEADGNTSTYSQPFHVREIPPFVNLTSVPAPGLSGYYEEFYSITFVANVTGLDPAVLFEWDFSAPGAEFQADSVGSSDSSVHVYSQIGNYTVKVRVTDSGGSIAVQTLSVEIREKPFHGDFGMFVKFTRDSDNNSRVGFSLGPLLLAYPDVVRAFYDFGDGSSLAVVGDLSAWVNHSYALGADYFVNITVTDDDGYSFVLSALVHNIPPTIQILNPAPNSVVRSGTPLLFLITPGTATLAGASYHIDGGPPTHFDMMYEIDTTGWSQTTHSVLVVVADNGANIVRFRTNVTIDDITPSAILYVSKLNPFGGDRLNITVRVDDPNVVASGIVLYLRFQGETAYSAFSVRAYDSRTFYRVVDLPVREGNFTFYAEVSDLAGNSVRTPLYTSAVELHFITMAWPFLLTASVLAALGTGGYFMRETKIAVDEAFVIYSDGRLIAHSTRRLKPGMDDQVLGSMFVAIQDFVKDSFKDVTSFTLRRLDFGDKSIVIEKGDHLYLAAVLHGTASRKVASRMQAIVGEIERTYGKHLDAWDGDFDKVRGVGDIMKKLYSKLPMLPGSFKRGA